MCNSTGVIYTYIKWVIKNLNKILNIDRKMKFYEIRVKFIEKTFLICICG